MVRPPSGPPRQKPRPFSNFQCPREPHPRVEYGDRYSPRSRDQREFPGRDPHFREPEEARAPPFNRRPRLMDGWRPLKPFRHASDQRRPQQQVPFHGGSPNAGPHRDHRRLSPLRPSHRHQVDRQGLEGAPPAYRRPFPRTPFNRPRHFHSELDDRRPPSLKAALHSPHRGPHRHPGPIADHQERSWASGPRWDHSPRERPEREDPWNGTGAFCRPRSAEQRFSISPQRKPQEFHSRSPYSERFSHQREARTQGERANNRRSGEWGSEHGPRRPYRSPKLRTLPPSDLPLPPPSPPSSPRFHLHPPRTEEKPAERPAKRSRSGGSECERSPKRTKAETPQRPVPPRPAGGRILSLKDKSALLKARSLRLASKAVLKTPPALARDAEKIPQTPPKKDQEDMGPAPLVVTVRREQPEGPKPSALKTRNPRGALPRKLPATRDAMTAPQGDTETLTIKVDVRHIPSTYSSSSDRQLSRDLVTSSRGDSGSMAGGRAGAPWMDNSEEPPIESYLSLNERFSKLQKSRSSPQDRNGRYSGLTRQVDMPLLNHKALKPMKNPGLVGRPELHSSSPDGKPLHLHERPLVGAPEHIRSVRRPLMASTGPRPSFHQNPAFRKSQSITTKYRNMQALRYTRSSAYAYAHAHAHAHGSTYNRGPLHRRW